MDVINKTPITPMSMEGMRYWSLFMDHQTREADLFITNLTNIAIGDQSAFSAEYAAMPLKKDKQEEALYHPML